jgi:hypothetical protein
MKSVEIFLRREEGDKGEMVGANPTKVHCKQKWKCHNETPCTTNIC